MSFDSVVAAGDVNKNVVPEKSKAKLQKAVKDFEAVFVGYMLKSMRESIPKHEGESDTFGGDLMQGMFDQELARDLSQHSQFGIGEQLYRQLTGEAFPHALTRSSGAFSFPPALGGLGRTVPVSGTLNERLQKYDSIIQHAAAANNVDSTLVKAVIAVESAGNPSARSVKNAKGLMQLLDSTATEMGVDDVWNPQQNITGGAKYLRQMLDRFNGDVTRAVASYNAGPERVERHGGIPPIRETQEYVNRVMQYVKHFEQEKDSMRDKQ